MKRKTALFAAVLVAASLGYPASAFAADTQQTPEPETVDVQRLPNAVVVGGDVIAADSTGVVNAVAQQPDGSLAVVESTDTSASADMPVGSVVAATRRVNLTWDRVAPHTSYTVYRDGVALSTTTLTHFKDAQVTPGSTYLYTIEARTPAAFWQESSSAQGTSVPDVGQPSQAKGPSAYDPSILTNPPAGARQPDHVVVIGVQARTPKAATKAAAQDVVRAAATATQSADTSTIQHTAFIPTATAPGFPCTLPGKYFGGDNRGFSPTSTAYRTRLSATINWNNNGSVTQSKSTHDTHEYNNNGTLAGVRNAGTSGMNISLTTHNSAQVRLSATHDIGNPFCAAGSIKYSWQALVWRTGNYTVSGEYRPAPNHEIDLKTGSTGSWVTIFKATNQGFSCLTGVCGNSSIQVTH